ncbi:hypothetical protein BX616_006252 [Lobosporangium transversale]|uniref:Homeobox domain-containing protein n=1 Tax=Lobosporangium transversale TaxID=64571 RepID=A0A1Y2GW60_9FUNG|nr:hypothetical protein BCR41DRAFT_348602 [Lobosporangium transversale]KAF9915395.1 hypothetical protein BX616_006252 [Lobosporangium transversale]ORZ24838.1 hypothetical protein BCR41DRAFT_348602 [Lobosporangium transversale]|eukprot:XP_021883819.1 hypothetical protein BCR41DRAFT_348602 [Lobosporangium transversale]
MVTPALSSPPFVFESFTEDGDTKAQQEPDPIKLPMSPPLSQECNVSLTAPEPLLESTPLLPPPQQHQQRHSQEGSQQQQAQEQNQLSNSIHPLDRSSQPAPKKTLNWVNALPSHFDATSPGHPRKRRRRTNREELQILEDAFAKNLLPDAATRQELGDRLGMSVRAVQIWFQNRRQTLRKKSISCNASQPFGSEEDTSKSDAECGGSFRRRSSGDSVMSLSPPLKPIKDGRTNFGALKYATLSTTLVTAPSLCPEVSSSPFAPTSSLASTAEKSSLTPRPSTITEAEGNSTLEPMYTPLSAPPPETKLRGVKSKLSDQLVTTETETSVHDIVDAETANKHLCLLLAEAKKRSEEQKVTPVMALWPETSSKVVLNAPVSGMFPTTTTFPTPKRTMSTPLIKPLNEHHVPSSALQQQQHSSRSALKSARKHRSMPEPVATSASTGSPRPCFPYTRTVSLMEQVINRQQQQQQHRLYHPRPVSCNFKQSALSMTGKYNLDNVCNKVTQQPPLNVTSSAGLSAVQLARRLQYVVSSNLKRVQSESSLQILSNAQQNNPINARFGQTAMRARRLSIGKTLFDSEETDEETDDERSVQTPSIQRALNNMDRSFGPPNLDQELTHQAQKRRAGSVVSTTSTSTTIDQHHGHSPSENVDGDETDEEDFVLLLQKQRARKQQDQQKQQHPQMAKKLGLVKSISKTVLSPSPISTDFNHRQHRVSSKCLKTSLSTLSLVTSSPTRDYGLELERSRSPLTSYPIIEKNRTWNSGLSTVEQQECNAKATCIEMNIDKPASPATETKDLNMDELECANVLAGLGWGR